MPQNATKIRLRVLHFVRLTRMLDLEKSNANEPKKKVAKDNF